VRLDQLKVTDDTAAGLVLVWIYLLVVSAAQPTLIIVIAGVSFGATSEQVFAHQVSMGAAQVVLILLLALLIAELRFNMGVRRLRASRLQDVDDLLAEEADSVTLKMLTSRALFLITPNLTDENAFCVPRLTGTRVILGGGLRRLVRKRRDCAGAILAHECAHLNRGDSQLLVGTWYTFIAYAAVAAVTAVIAQGNYWSHFNEGLSRGEQAGYSVSGVILRYIIYAFPLGGGHLVNAVIIGLLLVHLLRLREFIADEVAAQAGYRVGLVGYLQTKAAAARAHPAWLTFHPTSDQRRKRLQTGEGWDRVDGVFCFVCGTLFSLYNGVIMQIKQTREGILPSDRLIEIFQRYLADPLPAAWLLGGMLIYTVVPFLLANHLFRVTLSTIASHTYRNRYRSSLCVLATVLFASMVGMWFGSLLNVPTMTALYQSVVDGRESVSFWEKHVQAQNTVVETIMEVVAGGWVTCHIVRRWYFNRAWVRFAIFTASFIVSFQLVQIGYMLIIVAAQYFPIFRPMNEYLINHGWSNARLWLGATWVEVISTTIALILITYLLGKFQGALSFVRPPKLLAMHRRRLLATEERCDNESIRPAGGHVVPTVS
jgi:Zn-dependent protease with chaperone function